MKTCTATECNYPVFSKKLCLIHWRAEHGKPIFKHVTLKQTTGNRPAKVFKIRPVSKNREEALKRYRRLRDKYFEDHPVCEYPGCTSKRITLHHKRGRIGAFLTDKRYFSSLCHEHHRYVETHPLEAQRLGLSQLRLTV